MFDAILVCYHPSMAEKTQKKKRNHKSVKIISDDVIRHFAFKIS